MKAHQVHKENVYFLPYESSDFIRFIIDIRRKILKNYIMKTLKQNQTIKKLENSYHLKNGKFGSIPIAGKNDCYFLDVEKETDKAVYLQFLGKMFWIPKSAFILSSSFEGIDYFAIKPFFYNQMLSKF